ncbi:MAG: glucosyl-3-phosphoglycerate phosphatase [bacterium]|jgi:broad specificity phosphatase PhoE
MSLHPPPARTPLEAWRAIAAPAPEDPPRLRERVAEQPAAPDVELWLVRHGETTTNAARVFTGTSDAPLTVAGRLQAQDAGRAIAGTAFDLGFASQLERSVETLELMARAGDLVLPYTVQDPRLAERSFGELERTPIRPRDPRLAVDLTLAPTGGESYISMTCRCFSFLLDLQCLAADLRRPLAVLVSSHTGPMRVITAILDETTDPVVVRERLFGNGELLRRSLRRLVWPAFAGGLPGQVR